MIAKHFLSFQQWVLVFYFFIGLVPTKGRPACWETSADRYTVLDFKFQGLIFHSNITRSLLFAFILSFWAKLSTDQWYFIFKSAAFLLVSAGCRSSPCISLEAWSLSSRRSGCWVSLWYSYTFSRRLSSLRPAIWFSSCSRWLAYGCYWKFIICLLI